MKFTIASILLLATTGLANPVGLEKKMADLDARQAENVLQILKRTDFSKCPAKDFADCVPWFTTFNCMMPGNGVGTFPLGDSACNAQSTKVCQCLCNCDKTYCHAIYKPEDAPQHCKEKWGEA